MKEINLNFCFKGNREYIHGTDIFTKLIESNKIESAIDILFHGITKNNMTFFSEKPSNKDIKVTFKYQNNKEKTKLFGIENNEKPDCRYEYLEEKIINNSNIDTVKEIIILNSPTKYSFIEHIVAMNKGLLEKIYSDVDGKWYFTRLQLKKDIKMINITSLQIALKSNFQFKLTKSIIFVDEIEVGHIYFSLV